MKKKYIIFSIFTLVLLVALITSFNYFKTTNTYIDDNINNQTKIIKGISMNLEQTAGAGDYKTVTQSSWPTEGYKFNAELSRCENGSTLSWDDTKKAVIMQGNVSDKCYVYFDIFIPKIPDVCNSGDTLADCIKKYGDNGSAISNIYIHNSSLANGAGDNSYRYAGGDYVLTEKATNAGMKSLTSSSDTETDGITNFYCDGERQYLYNFGCDTTSQTFYFTLQYDTSNTQYKTYNEALEKAVSDGYLTKDNVKNFVCFGSGVSPCPTENLYRTIGVFDNKVKLMKYTYNTKEQLGEDGDFSETTTLADWGEETTYRGNSTTLDIYYWNDSTNKNTWSESLLNKINLNTNFINNIGTTWADKIATTTWKVGGNIEMYIRNKISSSAYKYEIINPVTTNTTDNATEYDAKIGLMYASDYGFAADPSAWTTKLIYYYENINETTIKSQNWMYMGYHEWIITRTPPYPTSVYFVQSRGDVSYNTVTATIIGVRPVFNLEQSVTYVSGTGTKSDPIIIN